MHLEVQVRSYHTHTHRHTHTHTRARARAHTHTNTHTHTHTHTHTGPQIHVGPQRWRRGYCWGWLDRRTAPDLNKRRRDGDGVPATRNSAPRVQLPQASALGASYSGSFPVTPEASSTTVTACAVCQGDHQNQKQTGPLPLPLERKLRKPPLCLIEPGHRCL